MSSPGAKTARDLSGGNDPLKTIVPMQCYSGGVLDVFIEPSLPRAQMVVVINELQLPAMSEAEAIDCAHCLRTFEKAHVA